MWLVLLVHVSILFRFYFNCKHGELICTSVKIWEEPILVEESVFGLHPRTEVLVGVHYSQVQVPSFGTETVECGVCQHPFLVSANWARGVRNNNKLGASCFIMYQRNYCTGFAGSQGCKNVGWSSEIANRISKLSCICFVKHTLAWRLEFESISKQRSVRLLIPL